MTDDIENKVKSLCGEYLSGPWKEPTNIIVHIITQGFGNRNFRCSLKCKPEDCDCPSHVIVHIYDGILTGNDSSYKFNGVSVEAVIVNMLHKIGMAPKLYGVFDSGRIEEYIPSTTCTFDDFENPVVNRLLAQKLARIHSLTVPISKESNKVEKFKNVVLKMLERDGKTMDNSKFDAIAEFNWYENVIQKISGQPVFNHGDVNPNNILVLRDKNQVVIDVMLIDYEACTYFYRSADIANLFNLRCVQFQNVDGKPKMIFASEESRKASGEMEKKFLEEYLEEWKSLSDDKDDNRNSLETLQMEVDFSRLFSYAFFICFLVNMSERCDPSCQQYLEMINYDDLKQKTIAKYKDQLEFFGAN